MKTKTTHSSYFGSFSSGFNGYIEYHDSPRYSKASEQELENWTQSRFEVVRNAARIELKNRAIEAWRNT